MSLFEGGEALSISAGCFCLFLICTVRPVVEKFEFSEAYRKLRRDSVYVSY